MNLHSQLLRQINPQFVQAGKVSSQAFRPMNDGLLSTYDGDIMTPEASFKHFTQDLKKESHGVMSVTCEECNLCTLNIIEDRAPFPEHISIDFSGLSMGDVKRNSQRLRNYAEKRNWLFQL